MVLLTHQMQSSYAAYPLRPQAWTKGVKLKPVVAIKLIGRKTGYNSTKSCFHLRNQPLRLPNRKSLKISSFKGNPKSDESEVRSDDSKSPTTSIKLSYASQERVESISPATENLFKKWLMMLRTQTFSETVDGIFSEKQPESQIQENQSEAHQWKMSKLMKAALSCFLRLDAAINFPLIIFVSLYLSINILYGAEVAKELTPMWVLGPPILSLYIMVIKGLYSLYAFTFKKTVSLVRTIPAIWYIAGGQLRARLWQPLINIKNMNLKELFKQKWKELEDWIVEKCLDCVESIWPFYCRTIRFLKKAHFI